MATETIPCEYLQNRLPSDLITDLQQQVTSITGNWSDYNDKHKRYIFMKDILARNYAIICNSEVPEEPNPSDFPN